METRESRRIAAVLTHRVGEGADAAQVAEAIASIWQELDSALGPILGRRGVAALYKRSLYLTGQARPGLAGLHEGVLAAMDLAALKAAFARESAAGAASGGGELLQTFYGLLTSLVGPSLTERLLRSVWAPFLNGPPAQDNPP